MSIEEFGVFETPTGRRVLVGSLGTIRALPWEEMLTSKKGNRFCREHKAKTLSPFTNKAGYQYVNVGQNYREAVHRLVAYVHLGDPPALDAHVNHLDSNKSNNAASNLEWCDHYANMRHAAARGRIGGFYGKQKIVYSKEVYREIINKKKTKTWEELAKEYDCHSSTLIRFVRNNKEKYFE